MAAASLTEGIYDDIAAARYHADDLAIVPTLSSSIGKKLLAETPLAAWHAHPRLNPTFKPKAEEKFYAGSVAHEVLLGRGGGFKILPFEDFRSGAAKAERDAWITQGLTPILSKHWINIAAMTTKIGFRLREIDECRALFSHQMVGTLDCGRAERVLLWEDMGGPICRAMIDFQGPSEPEIWDLKFTGASLSDESLARQIETLGYDMSFAFYLRGLTKLLPAYAGRWKCRWIFVSDEEPYECRVIELDNEKAEIGDRKAALAIEKWRRCLAEDRWPSWPPRVQTVPTAWNSREKQMARELHDDDAVNFRPSYTPMPSAPSGRLSTIAS